MSAPTRFDVTMLDNGTVRLRILERRGCVYVAIEEKTMQGDKASAILAASIAIAVVCGTDNAPRELLEGMEATAEIATEATRGT